MNRAATVTLAALCAAFLVRSCAASRAADHARAENARLRSEAAQARLEAHGYQTTLAHVTGSLRSTLADRDHWRALAEEPDAEPVAYVEATVEATGRVEGEARILDGHLMDGGAMGPNSHMHADSVLDRPASPTGEMSTTVDIPGFEGEATDDVFAIRWRLLLEPPPRFEADVRARIPVELVGYRLPDGALGVTAASPDPRVRVAVDDFVWAPVEEPRPSRWRWLLAGAAIGVIGWEMVR